MLLMIQKLTTEESTPTMGELARALKKSKGATADLLQRMEQDGLCSVPRHVITGKLAVLAKGRKLVER